MLNTAKAVAMSRRKIIAYHLNVAKEVVDDFDLKFERG
jgi:hypothetical protein